jgi:nucleoside-diphosphate-sugar epimerase
MPTIHGDGEQSRDFTYIDNVVSANLLAAAANAAKVAGRVFNVATGSRISLNQTVEMLREMTDYKGEVAYDDERPGDVKHSLADISFAQSQFGYKVEVGFRDGLRNTVDWYRRQAARKQAG